MGSLANCLRKHAKQLRPGEAEAIEKAAAAFEREGMSPSAAAERAVLEVMADEQRALRGFVEQVEAAGGAAPEWVAAAMEPRAAQAGPEKPAAANAREQREARNREAMNEPTWIRAERFKGRAAGVEAARNALASQVLRRDFGQSMEDFLAANPSERAFYDAAKAYIEQGASAAAPAPKPQTAPQPFPNTIFTEDAAEKARALLRARLGRPNAGLDPEMVQAGITLAGYHIEKGARTFAAYARAMLADLGDTVRPYLKQWYAAAYFDPRIGAMQAEMTPPGELAAAEVPDVPGSEPDLAGDRPDDAVGAVEVAGDAARSAARSEDRSDAEVAGSAGARGGRVRGDRPAAGREQGDLALDGGERPTVPASVARGDDGRRGDDAGGLGVSALPDRTDAAAQAARGRSADDREREKLAAQQAANARPVRLGDAANVNETLPYLLEGQREDVAKAEARFARRDGYGMLFTNGTGTGKTFTGLGIIARHWRAGKRDILIAAPNDKIIEDWIRSGARLGLTINQLTTTTSEGGRGTIVITTYANLRMNDALARRNWDLVVADEAHYLSAGKDFEDTATIQAVRAITKHPRGSYERAMRLHRDLYARMESARKTALAARKANPNSIVPYEIESAFTEASVAWDKALRAVEADVMTSQGASRTRLLALSATPFAYEKAVDWAEGYLFEYPASDSSSGYNVAQGRDQFFVQHFGYRMRYNKLTEPDAKVDRGVMQRQFNTWLKKEGSLSGRILDVEADYDRRFVLIDSGIGRRIDEALEWIRQRRSEAPDGQRQGWSALQDRIEDRFDYLSRSYLLEAIKASEVIPHVREHLAAGRKVVVFHDFKKGGGFNPFKIDPLRPGLPADNPLPDELVAQFNQALAAFDAEFADLIASNLGSMPSPLQVFQREFPNVLLFNGDVPPRQRLANVARFNDDGSGPQVLLVQSAAGKEGISLHDTTGRHQRVLFNLGLPVAPTTAIQTEGRIYRTGQVSNAILRYLNTGTNWERWAFASKIAQRASAAENLAAGESARALKQSFIDAFEDSSTDFRAGHDGEGMGGKAADKAANAALTDFDRAKAFYFGQQKKTSRNKSAEGIDYFPTPEPLALKMVEWADIRPGDRALEPSAGHGAIARWFGETVDATAVEPSGELRSRLALVFPGKIIGDTFENLHAVNKFDAIVMNPPFGHGGSMAIAHLAKAASHLREHGRVVAIIPTGPSADKRFDKWYESEDAKGIELVADIRLPAVTFERAGTNVAARVVVLDRNARIGDVVRDFSNAEDIGEFFERIRDSFIPQRSIPVQPEAEEAPAAAAPAPTVEGSSASFTLAQTKHAKTGADLFVATIKGRVERDVYDDLNAKAKAAGGYYSSFKGSGAVPGFQFKTAAARAAFLAAVGGAAPEGFYSLPAPKGLGFADAGTELPPVDLTRVRAEAQRAESEFGIRINVVANTSDPSVPARVRGANPKAQGYTDGYAAWIFTDNLRSVAHAQAVMAHEVVGHVGVERLVGPEEWQGIIDTVQGVLDGSIPSAADAGPANRAAALGPVERPAAVSEEVARIIREANERYPGASPSTLAREAVAVMAEKGVKASMLDRLLAAMRRALRRVFKRLAWSDAELRDLLARSAEGLRRAAAGAEPEARIEPDAVDSMAQGAGAPRTGVPLSVDAYHGTPNGEISQFEARNGGVYFTDRPDLANDYTRRRGLWQSVMRDGAAVYKQRITMRNPFVLDARNSRHDNLPTPWHTWRPKVFGRLPAESYSIQDVAAKVFAEGHDGLVVLNVVDTPSMDPKDRRYSTVYVVRDGDQVSGGFAQGAPDPSTERGAADLLRRVDAEGRRLASDRTIGQRIRDAIDTTRPGWYKLLSVAQVVEIGREVLPQAGTFGRMFREMGAWTNALMEPAALIAERWTELIGRDKEAAIRLGRLMHDATREQFDPDTQVPGDNRGRPNPASMIEQRLAREWAALPDDAKAIYRDVRDLYAKRRDLTMEALIDRVQQAINAGRAKAATLAAIRAHFESAKLKGPYFPLGRFGDYWIRARKGENGAPEFFMYETAGQWRTAMDELARDGYTIDKSGKKVRELRADEGPGAGFMGDLVGILDAAAEDDLAPLIDRQAAEALKDSVWQLYLESLPELSLRKSSLHRKGTLGFSQDALRVFSHHMTHGARQLGRLRFGHRLADLVRSMRDTADETRDPAKAADVTKYLDEAYQWAMNPTGSHFATKLTSLGFLWHLGVSPAAALVNVMQNATVAFPVLGARFGFDRSGAALLKASRDYLGTVSGSDQATSNRDQLDAEFDGDLGRALADLEASGIIDRTQTMALTGLGEDRAQLSVVQAKVMNVVGWAFHQAEKFNRETTAIAAYRLARQAGMSHESANEYAYTAVVRSHYDYSNANRPPIFRSDWAKVLFLFKQYAQNTIYLLARNVHQATRAESAEVRTQARRELAGILGMTFAVGGMAALPLYTPMMWFLSTVVALFGGGDDDQPWDAEREFRVWLAKHLGKFGGEVVARGVVNASDTIDLSSRVGMDDVLVRWPDRPMDGKELAMHYLEQAAGPVIGIGMSWFRALDQMASGDVGRGIETAVPKALRDAIKAIRYQVDDDALNLSGQPIIEDVSLIESAVQLAGFTPARLSQAYERASAAKRVEDKTLKRRSELLASFYTASREPDPRKRAEALAEAVGAVAAWNAANPDWPVTGDAIRASVAARMNAAQRTQNGAYLNPTVARRLQKEPY